MVAVALQFTGASNPTNLAETLSGLPNRGNRSNAEAGQKSGALRPPFRQTYSYRTPGESGTRKLDFGAMGCGRSI